MRRHHVEQKVDHELMRALDHDRTGAEHPGANSFRHPRADVRVPQLLVIQVGILRIRSRTRIARCLGSAVALTAHRLSLPSSPEASPHSRAQAASTCPTLSLTPGWNNTSIWSGTL